VVDIAATLEQARELYGTGRLDEAAFVLVTAISFASGCDSLNSVPPRLDPASASSAVPLLKLLGDIYTDQLRWDDAIATYTLAIDSGGALNARGAFFGRANASEGKALQMSRLDEKNTTSADALYTQAVMDYTLCLGDTDTLNSTVTYATSLEKATITFERARALGALRRWADAKRDYETAAGLFLSGRDKKKSDIATAQAAFCAFEDGDLLGATHTLEALSLRLYSSDVRAALVAAYYKAGDFTKAESLWLDLCQLQGAQCGKYSNEKWLLEYRQWTPGVVRGMQDFLGMR
jgi:tetratricopeptide (TPR) repeat protein